MTAIVELEGDIADEERPDFVAESVSVKRTLCSDAELALDNE